MPASDTKRETSRQYRRGSLCDVHKETCPPHWPGHRGTYLPLEGTKDRNVVFLTLVSRSLGDSELRFFSPLRSNLKIFLMPGCLSCVITGCTVRTRSCDPLERPQWERSPPQLPLSHHSPPRLLYGKPRSVPPPIHLLTRFVISNTNSGLLLSIKSTYLKS